MTRKRNCDFEVSQAGEVSGAVGMVIGTGLGGGVGLSLGAPASAVSAPVTIIAGALTGGKIAHLASQNEIVGMTVGAIGGLAAPTIALTMAGATVGGGAGYYIGEKLGKIATAISCNLANSQNAEVESLGILNAQVNMPPRPEGQGKSASFKKSGF